MGGVMLFAILGLFVAGTQIQSLGDAVNGFFVQMQPSTDLRTLLMENFKLWGVLYGFATLVLYIIPTTRRYFAKNKFNEEDPPGNLMVKEFFRSVRGVAIASTMEHLTFTTLANFKPLIQLPILDGSLDGSIPSPMNLGIAVIILYLWGDVHFYWTHRMLHAVPFLWKNVHKIHHESKNPTPLSGLSMHWLESMVYFSSAPLGGLLVLPPWAVRALYKGLIMFPLEGHWGYGTWDREDSYNHFLHHSEFKPNYGSSPLWDNLMGTTIPLVPSIRKKFNIGRQTVTTQAHQKNEMKADSVWFARLAIRGLALIFALLSLRSGVDPIGSFEGHQLNLHEAQASALAELRAYYLGTMSTLSYFLFIFANGDINSRKQGHFMGALVLGLFTLVRGYSHCVDGYTNNKPSDVMWLAEAVGTSLFVWLYQTDADTAEMKSSPRRSRSRLRR